MDILEWVDFQLSCWSLQLHSISDQLSECTLLLIVVGKQNPSAICAMWLTIQCMTMTVFLLSPFVCLLLFFFLLDYPFIVMRPSQIKFPVLHPGMKGRYLCPKPKFQNPFLLNTLGWSVIWYSWSFEGGQSPCWEGRMPWNKTNTGIYLS